MEKLSLKYRPFLKNRSVIVRKIFKLSISNFGTDIKNNSFLVACYCSLYYVARKLKHNFRFLENVRKIDRKHNK